MPKRLLLPLALLSAPLLAADMDVTVEIPRLQVAEYHRPYVAIWLEKPDQSHAADLAVWYDLKLKDKEGENGSRTCASGGVAAVAAWKCRWTASAQRPAQWALTA
tara:strand:- start:153223 stop:153537 length:315 start_codon:yes stop_codon:yes gene_type:complete